MLRKKKPTKNSRPVDDAMKQDITSAVEQIPHLLYHSLQEKKGEEQASKPVSLIRNYRQRSKAQTAKKNLLLFGVSCLTLVIVVMWTWNMRVFWYHTQETNKDAPPVWEGAKQDLSSVLDIATEQKKSIDELVKKINDTGKKADDAAVADAMNALLVTSALATTTVTTTEKTP
jgi:hypothetical protein